MNVCSLLATTFSCLVWPLIALGICSSHELCLWEGGDRVEDDLVWVTWWLSWKSSDAQSSSACSRRGWVLLGRCSDPTVGVRQRCAGHRSGPACGSEICIPGCSRAELGAPLSSGATGMVFVLSSGHSGPPVKCLPAGMQGERTAQPTRAVALEAGVPFLPPQPRPQRGGQVLCGGCACPSGSGCRSPWCRGAAGGGLLDGRGGGWTGREDGRAGWGRSALWVQGSSAENMQSETRLASDFVIAACRLLSFLTSLSLFYLV